MASPTPASAKKRKADYHSLHEAVFYGDCAAMAELLDAGVDIETPLTFVRGPHDVDSPGSLLEASPLIAAVRFGHEPLMRLLIDRGATLEAFDGYNKTPAFHAVLGRHESGLRLLIEAGASMKPTHPPDHPEAEYPSPARAACIIGSLDLLRIVIEAGAYIEAPDGSGHNCLMLAASHDHPECLVYLIGCGARIFSVDEDGNSALSHAAHVGSLSCLRLLIEADANVHAQNLAGLTPAMQTLLAFRDDKHPKPYTECFAALIEAGTDVNAVDYKGISLLSHAVGTSSHKEFRLLLQSGVDLDVRDHKGATAAAWAARLGKTQYLVELAQAGADLFLPDHNGTSPILHAQTNGHLDCAGWLGAHAEALALAEEIANAPIPSPPPTQHRL